MNQVINKEASLPVDYHKHFVPNPDVVFKTLWNELEWVRHDKVPRREYYVNPMGVPYTYGRGAGVRTYQPQPSHGLIDVLFAALDAIGHKFDVVFLNGYEDSSDHLGWHADDSPEMDDDRAIAIVSLGAEREIWFREQGRKEPVDRLLLENGSLCLMKPGMQDTHHHRIPKCDRECGPRISLTFRGYKPQT